MTAKKHKLGIVKICNWYGISRQAHYQKKAQVAKEEAEAANKQE